MKYLQKLTNVIRDRENLPVISEVMTIDEVMEYLVNYGIYGTRFRQFKNALLKNEESEIIKEIIQSIDNFKDEKNVATTISNVKLVNLPEDIKIGRVPTQTVTGKTCDSYL